MAKIRIRWALVCMLAIVLSSYIALSWPGAPPAAIGFSGLVFIDGTTAPNGVNISVYATDSGSGNPILLDTSTTAGGAGFFPGVSIIWDDPDTGVDEGVTYSAGGENIWFVIDVGNISGLGGMNVGGAPYAGSIVNGTAGGYATLQATSAYSSSVVNGFFFYDTPFFLISPPNTSNTNNSNPSFNWSGYENGVRNYTLIVDDNSNMASPVATIADIKDTNYTSALGLGSGTYYWRIDAYNSGAFYKSTGVFSFTVDTTPPNINSYSPTNFTWVSSSPAAVTVTTNENAECKFDTNPGLSYAAKANTMTGTGTAHTGSWALGVQGNNTWYVQCRDTAGNEMPDDELYYIRYDNIAPTPGTLTIGGGAYYTTNPTLGISWSGFSDAGSGVATYYYGFTNNQGTTTSDGTTALTTATLGGGTDGNRTVYVWAADSVPTNPNIGTAASDWIIIDSTDPNFYGWIQNPADIDETTVGAVTVTVQVNDTNWNNSLPLIRYQYGTDGWYAYQNMTALGGNTYQYTIPQPIAGWGAYLNEYLYYEAQATDAAGNIGNETRSDEVDLFNIAPILTPIPNQIADEGTNFSITLSATDPDPQIMTFTAAANFTFIRLTNYSVIAWWVPTNDDIGSNQIIFNVSDGMEWDAQTVTIDVSATNDAPRLTPIGSLKAYLHKPFLHYIFGDDPDNRNAYLLDNNILIFDIVENLRWFRINSYFNVSNASYYGVINFTPLLSHRGEWNISLYVTDGVAIDSENLLFTVGYCGDKDAGGEPWCDEDYESCISCARDCGTCSDSSEDFMTIIIDPRNCLERNFTIWTYELYDRATCVDEGLIVEGMEVCTNLSKVKVEVYMLQYGLWEKIDEYISDSNGEITFVPTAVGEYKLVGTKSGYPKAFEYLEIRPCIQDEEEEADTKANKTYEEPVEEPQEPIEDKPTVIPGEPEEIASILQIVTWFVLVSTMLIAVTVGSYYMYEKNKDNVVWLLKARIYAKEKTFVLKKKGMVQWKKLKRYLGYE